MKNKYANSAGKGDKPRPTDLKKYGPNYDRIFGHKEFNGRKFKATYPDDPQNYECIMLKPGEEVICE